MEASSWGFCEVTGTRICWSEGTCPGLCNPLHTMVSTGVPTTLSCGPLHRPGDVGSMLLVARPPVKVGSIAGLNAKGLKFVMLLPCAYVGVEFTYRKPSTRLSLRVTFHVSCR